LMQRCTTRSSQTGAPSWAAAASRQAATDWRLLLPGVPDVPAVNTTAAALLLRCCPLLLPELWRTLADTSPWAIHKRFSFCAAGRSAPRLLTSRRRWGMRWRQRRWGELHAGRAEGGAEGDWGGQRQERPGAGACDAGGWPASGQAGCPASRIH
jgi:hypothetical protein